MVPPPSFDFPSFGASSHGITSNHEPRRRSKADGSGDSLDASEADLEPPICRFRIVRSHRTIAPISSRSIIAFACLIFSAFFVATASAASVGSASLPAILDEAPTRVLQERRLPFYDFVPSLTKRQDASSAAASTCSCSPTSEPHNATFVVEAIMIPVLVLLSGAFAGLTLGYMSLDATQLSVLSKSGTEKQRRLANKIVPLRKDGHLLLITLLISNMICNEILPIVSDPVLGGGVQAVIVSTVLIVIFSEIIPQSVCSRFGLQIGAACTIPVRGLVYLFYPVSWPIARLLTKILGAHSGIIYRRAELKELVTLHGVSNEHGGDLNRDVVTIVGATLDLQEKRVRDAMTPMSKCFMLNLDSKLDYETLGKVMQSGHSRIPVYEEVKPSSEEAEKDQTEKSGMEKPALKRKIRGVLLTKQLILIDPEDAVPLRNFPLHPLPLVPDVMPLLNILNSFQEGRSHLAIVCPRKPGFYPNHYPFGAGVAPGQEESSSPHSPNMLTSDTLSESVTRASGHSTSGDEGSKHRLRGMFRRKRSRSTTSDGGKSLKSLKDSANKAEQGEMPAELNSSLALAAPLEEDMPMGIITLEDVIEELLGEEILDETDKNEMGETAVAPYLPEEAVQAMQKPKTTLKIPFRPKMSSMPTQSATVMTPGANLGSQAVAGSQAAAPTPAVGSAVPTRGMLKATATRLSLGSMARSRSAPGKSRSMVDGTESSPATTPKIGSTEVAQAEATTPATAAETKLPQISEARSDAGSDVDASAEPAQPSSGGMRIGPGGAPLQRSLTPGATAVPPRLSDAILLERGRRHLVRQGADPNVTLRLAQPSSLLSRGQPADGSTPVISLPTPSASGGTPLGPIGGGGPKGAFKSPTRRLSVPQRSMTGTPRSSSAQEGSSGGRTPVSNTVAGTEPSVAEEKASVGTPTPAGEGDHLGGAKPLVESPPAVDDSRKRT